MPITEYTYIAFNNSLIHLGYFYSAFKSTTTTQKRSRQSTDTVSEFSDEAPQAIASEGLVQGPYVAAIAGFEPTTLRTKGDESTDEPPLPAVNGDK